MSAVMSAARGDAPAAEEEGVGEADGFAEPVEDAHLEFGAGGAGDPAHALHAQPRGHQIAQNGWAGSVGREEGEEVRRLPVRQPGQDLGIGVREDAVERRAGVPAI